MGGLVKMREGVFYKMLGLHVAPRIFHYKKEVPTSANHISWKLGHTFCREPVPLQNGNPASDKNNFFGSQSYRIISKGKKRGRITRTNPLEGIHSHASPTSFWQPQPHACQHSIAMQVAPSTLHLTSTAII